MSARTDLIKLVHVAKRDLSLTDESYRDLLLRVTGATSSAKLALPQLDKVMAEFRRLGWKPKPKRRRTGTSDDPQIRKIYALWADLVELGIGGDDPVAALRAFVQRQTKSKANPQGISDPRFLRSGTDTNKVLEGLKGWLARVQAKAEAA